MNTRVPNAGVLRRCGCSPDTVEGAEYCDLQSLKSGSTLGHGHHEEV